jgi:hypothetical protein
LTPGIEKQFGLEYDLWDTPIPRIFHMAVTDSRFLDRQGWQRYGLPGAHNPGLPIKQDVLSPSFGKRYTMVNYALGS